MSEFCCGATGLSSHAIARRFGYCHAGGIDHPYDPADLRRCRDYCNARGIGSEQLAERMRTVSPTWAALVAEWPQLLAMLAEEEHTGQGPRTYERMAQIRKSVLSDTRQEQQT